MTAAVYEPRREARAREAAERRAWLAELLRRPVCLDCGAWIEPGVEHCVDCTQPTAIAADTSAC